MRFRNRYILALVTMIVVTIMVTNGSVCSELYDTASGHILTALTFIVMISFIAASTLLFWEVREWPNWRKLIGETGFEQSWVKRMMATHTRHAAAMLFLAITSLPLLILAAFLGVLSASPYPLV